MALFFYKSLGFCVIVVCTLGIVKSAGEYNQKDQHYADVLKLTQEAQTLQTKLGGLKKRSLNQLKILENSGFCQKESPLPDHCHQHFVFFEAVNVKYQILEEHVLTKLIGLQNDQSLNFQEILKNCFSSELVSVDNDMPKPLKEISEKMHTLEKRLISLTHLRLLVEEQSTRRIQLLQAIDVKLSQNEATLKGFEKNIACSKRVIDEIRTESSLNYYHRLPMNIILGKNIKSRVSQAITK
ncbi:uncharacterized protein LOC106090366 [Stomoxys calcitrans]|uniref:uncharacterized protein LOC106090366 n=1 Tax=Stomoxys calcitrans TaxID=35570 RepID=UPI0027E2F30C|nr:uncharacterized protein LOC106090366 [Stomoxys calcitrans]